MKYGQVRYFIALCRTLNFTRAAEVSNVTQPALTRAIQKLEEELGGQLIYRERNLTRLTEFGRSMQPHLEAMLGAADAASQAARARTGIEPSPLRIGLGPAIRASHIVNALRGLVRFYPELSVRFQEGGAAALVEAMLSETLDCALLPEDPMIPQRLHRWNIARESCGVVMPAGHRLASSDSLAVTDFQGETLLIAEQCGGFANRLRKSCGEVFRERSCEGSLSQMLDRVGAGLGLALLPDRLSVSADLVVRSLAEPRMERAILLTLVAGRPQRPVVVNFVKLCRAGARASDPRAFGWGQTSA